jgi:hypothetical protein
VGRGVGKKRRREGVTGDAAEKVPTPGPFSLGKKGGLFRCRPSVLSLEPPGIALLLLFGVGLVGGETGCFGGTHRPVTVLVVYADRGMVGSAGSNERPVCVKI